MHRRIVCREQGDVGALKLGNHSFRTGSHSQRDIPSEHGLNDLMIRLKINQLDGKPIFLEEPFFLSHVGLTELSRDETGYAQSDEFRTMRRVGIQKCQQKKENQSSCYSCPISFRFPQGII